MNISLFIILITLLSSISSLFTEAIKKTFKVTKPTLLVLAVSAVVGWVGGAAAYTLMGIAFTLNSVVTLVLLAPTIWLISTTSYDKVMEIITQIKPI